MPLIKNVTPAVPEAIQKGAIETVEEAKAPDTGCKATPAATITARAEGAQTLEKTNAMSPSAEPRPVYTGRKTAAPMSKDDYWRNKEDHDLRKDPQIRLSGVLQALLGSVNFGQYCIGTTPEDYLAKVEEASLRLAKFVKEKAE